MAEGPLISIGMPVFNCAGTLHDAVHSILDQDHADWELLILDDGSTDGTLDLARSFADARIRVFSDGENRGLAARLNEAVGMARGRFFARMDGDDIAFPDRLSVQLAYLQAHPGIDLVGGWALVFASDGSLRGRRATPESHAAICAAPWAGFPLLHPSFMGHTKWFREHPYDEALSKAQDQVLLATACQRSRYANVQQLVLAYREDVPSLAKLRVSRRCLLRGMFAAYSAQGRGVWAWRAVFAQGLRMLVDVVAAIPGLRTRQLRRRSAPLSDEDVRRWRELRAGLQARDATHG